MQFTEYAQFDGIGLAELIQRGEVSAPEVLRAAISRIEHRNPEINAVILKLFDQAAQAAERIQPGAAEGPFDGVPFLIKDLGQYLAGVATAGGSRLFEGTVKQYDSTLIGRYRQAGLLLCGKTNTPELGLATTTEPVLFGPTRNPMHPEHTPGGSSGGAAAAVASGMVPMAHASDGGGSIRIPASCCGLVGLKPTRARVPLGPYAVEGWGGLSTTHAVTKSVRDSALLLDISSGPELGAPYYAPGAPNSFHAMAAAEPAGLKLGLLLEPFSGAALDPEIRLITESAAQACTDLGHTISPTHLDALKITPDTFTDAHGILALAHVAATIDERLQQLGRELQPGDVELVTERNYHAGRAMSAAQYAWAQNHIRAEGQSFAGYFARGIDVLITPTMATLPPRLGELDMMGEDEDAYLSLLNAMIGFTAIFNDTGLPAISVPMGSSKSGLPVGVQLIAGMGQEGLLLSLAGQLERAGLFQQTLDLT